MTQLLSLILALLGIALVFLATTLAPNMTWPQTPTENLAAIYLVIGLGLTTASAYLAAGQLR